MSFKQRLRGVVLLKFSVQWKRLNVLSLDMSGYAFVAMPSFSNKIVFIGYARTNKDKFYETNRTICFEVCSNLVKHRIEHLESTICHKILHVTKQKKYSKCIVDLRHSVVQNTLAWL